MTRQALKAALDEWLTVAEAADHLRVSRDTIYRWARQEKLRLYKIAGTATRVRRQDVEGLARPMIPDPWARLSQESFADWDNPKDAVYDHWEHLYGLPKR